MEPNSEWVTKENLFYMKYFYRDHLGRIRETRQDRKRVINECIPVHTEQCQTILLPSVETFCSL